MSSKSPESLVQQLFSLAQPFFEHLPQYTDRLLIRFSVKLETLQFYTEQIIEPIDSDLPSSDASNDKPVLQPHEIAKKNIFKYMKNPSVGVHQNQVFIGLSMAFAPIPPTVEATAEQVKVLYFVGLSLSMVPHRWVLEPTHVAGTIFSEKDFVQTEKKDVPYSFNCMVKLKEDASPTFENDVEKLIYMFSNHGNSKIFGETIEYFDRYFANPSLEEIPPLYHVIIEDKKRKIVAADGEYLKECKLLYDEAAVAGVVTKK
uniref:Uncharacterized protein n=1 Tax=Panagrolaimus davidi TaxID=227884 RepID=A0A914QZ62_9BILA